MSERPTHPRPAPDDAIRQHMTRSPHTIGHDQPVATAQSVMREHRIWQLPVLEAGKLVGLVSERDLYVLETIRGVDGSRLLVSDAMTRDVYCVESDATLEEVTKTMLSENYGCVVVTERSAIVGVFTTADALRMFLLILDAHEAPRPKWRRSSARDSRT